MTKDTLTSARNALIKDPDHLRRDTGHIVGDVKKHAIPQSHGGGQKAYPYRGKTEPLTPRESSFEKLANQ